MSNTNNPHCYGVILAGGLGTRFWPISRKGLPKQFLDFTDTGKTFLQRTYERISQVIPAENIFVVTLKEFRSIVLDELPELPIKNLLEELYNRNTAPCIAYAMKHIIALDPEAVVICSPSDQIIPEQDIFNKTMTSALSYAGTHEELVAIGVVPTRPDTNFGYIQVTGGAKAIVEGNPVRVKTFTEKPSKELATVFINTGEFLWNCGLFVWKASVVLNEMTAIVPEIMSLWQESCKNGVCDVDKIYTDCPKISIDHAVMEKSDKVTVIPAKFHWADIGNWESLYDYMSNPDDQGNVTNIRGKHLFKKNGNSIIYSQGKNKLIAIKGLEDMIVIDTEDVLMICPRNETQLKEFVSELAMPEFEEYR